MIYAMYITYVVHNRHNIHNIHSIHNIQCLHIRTFRHICICILYTHTPCMYVCRRHEGCFVRCLMSDYLPADRAPHRALYGSVTERCILTDGRIDAQTGWMDSRTARSRRFSLLPENVYTALQIKMEVEWGPSQDYFHLYRALYGLPCCCIHGQVGGRPTHPARSNSSCF